MCVLAQQSSQALTPALQMRHNLRWLFVLPSFAVGTVELGGMADTEPDVCAASCEAILAFLCDNDCIARSGGLSDFPAAPPVTCDATPLAGVHEVMPPHAGDKCRAETLMPFPPPPSNPSPNKH